jgi:hypothetical protein
MEISDFGLGSIGFRISEVKINSPDIGRALADRIGGRLLIRGA